MATTCNFGQVKDLRLKSMCMGDITIIDPYRNIYGNNITATANVIACNIDASKSITAGGNIRGENIISNCVNLNSIKLKIIDGSEYSIPNDQNTIVTWGELEYGYNTSGISWDGNSRVNIYKDGVYHVEASVDWNASPDGYRNMFTLVNGVIAGSGDATETRSNVNVIQSCSCDIALRKDDYVQLQVYQSGELGGLGINPYNLSNLSVRYIHDITSNEYPVPVMAMMREFTPEESEIIQLRREMQDLRRQMANNTFTNNRNQRLRSFGNKNLARNRLM